MTITVVIPAVNEASTIGRAIGSALPGASEVIVVDGGSVDGTAEVARTLGALVIDSPPGRGAQMDAGLNQAVGDAVLFLHADTVLPVGWHDSVEAVLADPKNAAGAFGLSIDAPGLSYRLVEFGVRLRASVLGLVYGDQAIFARRESLVEAGGFGKLPLMEDVDCVKRLRGRGRVVLADAAVTTSARRWAGSGVARTTLRNWLLIILYHAGVSPERLHSIYYRGSTRGWP